MAPKKKHGPAKSKPKLNAASAAAGASGASAAPVAATKTTNTKNQKNDANANAKSAVTATATVTATGVDAKSQLPSNPRAAFVVLGSECEVSPIDVKVMSAGIAAGARVYGQYRYSSPVQILSIGPSASDVWITDLRTGHEGSHIPLTDLMWLRPGIARYETFGMDGPELVMIDYPEYSSVPSRIPLVTHAYECGPIEDDLKTISDEIRAFYGVRVSTDDSSAVTGTSASASASASASSSSASAPAPAPKSGRTLSVTVRHTAGGLGTAQKAIRAERMYQIIGFEIYDSGTGETTYRGSTIRDFES